MDCPSEEQMIRMKLADLTNINSLDFDIPNRQLTVFHTDNHDQIFQRLDNLKFLPLQVFFFPPLLVFFTNKPTYADNVSEHCSGKLIGIKFTETPVLPMCSLIKCRRVV